MRSLSGQTSRIILGDNLAGLGRLADGWVPLIYIDPPFNTGRSRRHTRLRVTADEQQGDRTGFQGRRYRTTALGSRQYADAFDDYCAFLEPRLLEAWRVLAPHGSIFIHLDYRESHYVKVLCDRLWGRDHFMNEIIWAYDYGGRSKRRWPAKHDTIFWYARDPQRYTFHFDEMDRIPYMAPGLVGKEKAARGKTPTDVWWHTIVPTQGSERTGYPTQKPEGVLERIIKVHSSRGDWVLDFFAGSGTTGAVAARLGRRFLLIDDNPEACEIMCARLVSAAPILETLPPPS
jgi:site-specific DNA-methyltransferase (adenine-specific)